MSTTATEFEPRMGQSLWLQTPCEGCECPPGRTRWLAPLCAGTIAGTVYDARTGEPLENINVWVESFETGSFGEAVTDILGHYLINELEAGQGYVLTASGPGYSYRLLEDGVLPEEGLVQDVRLVRTGAIRGTITNTNGQPIEGATIYLSQQDEPSWGGGETLTNSQGHFCFCSASINSSQHEDVSVYSVVVAHQDYSYVERQLHVTPRYERHSEVQLEIELPERATIQGFVTSGGFPLEGAKVYLCENLSGLLLDTQTGFTDGIGGFSLSVDAPAAYSIVVQGKGTSLFDGEVAVSPGQETAVPLIDLILPGVIRGKVADLSGQPVSGAIVELLTPLESGPVPGEAIVTGLDGRYEINDVQADVEWLVRVVMPTTEVYGTSPSDKLIAITPNMITVVDLQGDILPPQCSITAPAEGHIVSGTTPIDVEASDNGGIKSIHLKVDGNQVESVYFEFPINQIEEVRFELDSSLLNNGNQLIEAESYDIYGNSSTSDPVGITVENL